MQVPKDEATSGHASVDVELVSYHGYEVTLSGGGRGPGGGGGVPGGGNWGEGRVCEGGVRE